MEVKMELNIKQIDSRIKQISVEMAVICMRSRREFNVDPIYCVHAAMCCLHYELSSCLDRGSLKWKLPINMD